MRTLALAVVGAGLCCPVAKAGPNEPLGGMKPQPPSGLRIMEGKVSPIWGVLRPMTFNYVTGAIGPQHRRAPAGRYVETVYDNTENPTGYGLGQTVGAVIGDDITMTAAGVLHELEFSIFNPFAEDGVTLTSVDITFDFYLSDPAGEEPIGTVFVDDLDLTDGGTEEGLPPGYMQPWTLTGLLEGQNPIELPEVFVVTQTYADARGPDQGPGPEELGLSFYDPPVVGSSHDRIWLDTTPIGGTAQGWYWFMGDLVANFYYAVMVDVTDLPPEFIYANITNPTGWGWGGVDLGSWWGDDHGVDWGGVLKEIRVDMNYWETDPLGTPITAFDLDIGFADISDPHIVFDGFTQHFDLSGNPFAPGSSRDFVLTGLDALDPQITLNRSSFVMKVRYLNLVGGEDYYVGPSFYDPPTEGTSDDMIWYENPDGSDGWYWFGCCSSANFKVAIGVVERQVLTLPILHLPDLGVPAQFEVDPQDDLGQGGFFDPPVFVETPAYLAYDPPVDIKFRNGTMPLEPDRELQGWWMGLAAPLIFGPDYTGPLIVSAKLSKVVLLFNTVLDVSAISLDAGVENVEVHIYDYDTGDDMYDIDGLGDGTTPFTRKYVPMNDYSYDYEYYQWICFQAPEELPSGTPFLRYDLTYVDGTTTEFDNPDFPGRVCLRIEAFAAAEVVYGEAAPCERGDLNCDGAINGFDIDPFVLASVDETGYYALYPACDHMCADIDCDGAVNGFDIDGFVVCVTAGVCDPCP